MKQVSVQIVRTDDSTTYTFHRMQDSLRGIVYTNESFQPQPGERYALTIEGDSLPEVTGSTTIPNQPQIDSASISFTSNLLRFDLKASQTIQLYDIYIYTEKTILSRRIRPAPAEDTAVDFNLQKSSGAPLLLQIFGYENNFAGYLTAPVSIKPQTYRETITTVSGGYGVFGAVSRLEYQFQ